MRFVSRGEWGARYGRGNTNITPGRGGVTVHYEGGGRHTGQPHSECDNRVRNIESYHVNGNGWAGIAYTALVCEHGYVFEGRGLGRRTAANGTNSGNQNWYAVCALIGDRDPLPDDLLAGLRDAIEWCRDDGAGSRVNGHRDHLATSCPGDELYAWVRAGMPASTTGGDPLIGLKKGDTGQPVKALQELCRFAGQGETIDRSGGSDGIYGDGTAEALRLVRKSVGSRALAGFGDKVDGWAYSQLIKAVAIEQGGN